MFDSVGWGEIVVLVVAALFILGPERLPGAAAWLGSTIRKVKGMAAGAAQQVRDEIGPEFDELRKPLDELRTIRRFNPRQATVDLLKNVGPTAAAASRQPAPTTNPSPDPVTSPDPAGSGVSGETVAPSAAGSARAGADTSG